SDPCKRPSWRGECAPRRRRRRVAMRWMERGSILGAALAGVTWWVASCGGSDEIDTGAGAATSASTTNTSGPGRGGATATAASSGSGGATSSTSGSGGAGGKPTGSGGAGDPCGGCPAGQVCDGQLGCVDCLDATDCTDAATPFCVSGSCVECTT